MNKWVFKVNGVEKTLLQLCAENNREYSSACRLARKGYSIDRILKKRHGACGTKAYKVWISLRRRCGNKNDRWYSGVKVCERWSASFENFLADMGEPPSHLHQIDRIKRGLGYTPRNCRWVTPKENALNRRNTRWVTYQGRTMCMSDWAVKMGVTVSMLKYRLDKGWPLKKALSPVRLK